jgi:hypothetical protein
MLVAVLKPAAEDVIWRILEVIRCLDLRNVMEERPN